MMFVALFFNMIWGISKVVSLEMKHWLGDMATLKQMQFYIYLLDDNVINVIIYI